MRTNRFRGAGSGFLAKPQLMRLRLKAVRAGVWFKALPRIDRVLVDLTIRVADDVRSFTLAQNILEVVRKLEGVMESRFVRAVREVGFPVARRLGLVAERLGNAAGRDWGSDRGFAGYLAAMALNEPHLFKG